MSTVTVEQTELWRKSDEEITALARDMVTNVVFFARDPDVIRLSFLVIMLTDWDEAAATKVGAVYEQWAKAGPFAVNNYPVFLSAQFVHVDDLPRLQAEVTRMAEALGIRDEDGS